MNAKGYVLEVTGFADSTGSTARNRALSQRRADAVIREGDFVLIDLWAKLDRAGAVYSDLTWTGFVGKEVPADEIVSSKLILPSADSDLAEVRDLLSGDGLIPG